VSEPEDLIRTITDEGVRDLRLLGTLRSVPRIGFVPANLAGQAYEDKPLPIPHRQVTTQPSLVAKMVEALGLAGSERVLEFGTGYAWQTALLARLCGFVWTVERFGDVAEAARENLARFGVTSGRKRRLVVRERQKRYPVPIRRYDEDGRICGFLSVTTHSGVPNAGRVQVFQGIEQPLFLEV